MRVIIRLKLFIVIYYNIFQFFLQKRYSEADFVMKVAWKIALYNLVFHQLPLIQHCSIFYKKNAFQSTKNFRRIQWQNMLRMASECISYNLEFPLLYKFRLLLHITVNPPPLRGNLPRKSLISRMDWVSCTGDINLPHDLPPTKKSSTIKSWPTFCNQYFWKFPFGTPALMKNAERYEW